MRRGCRPRAPSVSVRELPHLRDLGLVTRDEEDGGISCGHRVLQTELPADRLELPIVLKEKMLGCEEGARIGLGRLADLCGRLQTLSAAIDQNARNCRRTGRMSNAGSRWPNTAELRSDDLRPPRSKDRSSSQPSSREGCSFPADQGDTSWPSSVGVPVRLPFRQRRTHSRLMRMPPRRGDQLPEPNVACAFLVVVSWCTSATRRDLIRDFDTLLLGCARQLGADVMLP